MFQPKWWHFGLNRFQPCLSLFIPILRFLITLLLDKLEKLSIWNEHWAHFKTFDIKVFFSELIIPTINSSILNLPIPYGLECWNLLHLIGGYLRNIFCELGAINKIWMGSNFLNRESSYNHWGGFKMNSFVLDSHHDNPGIWVPTNLWINLVDDIQNDILDGLPIKSDLLNRGPIVVILV